MAAAPERGRKWGEERETWRDHTSSSDFPIREQTGRVRLHLPSNGISMTEEKLVLTVTVGELHAQLQWKNYSAA